MFKNTSGQERAWEILINELEPEAVCKNADATFNSSLKFYTLKLFGHEIYVSLKDKKITGSSSESEFILNNLGYFSELSILWYLISSKNIPPSEKLINPSNIKGGELFFRGSHVLPLDKLAQKYENDIGGFFERGKIFHSEKMDYGDASIKLYPSPRVPVIIILWQKDDEFPARADLLLDATCELHLPADIIWATAMISVLIMI
ncbi:MAG: DUF3786 domain-containing protein [Nitrospirae bacterium]|nr:DUF3786 domain-containing protein [Nitrospirota bacterium]